MKVRNQICVSNANVTSTNSGEELDITTQVKSTTVYLSTILAFSITSVGITVVMISILWIIILTKVRRKC